MEKELADRSTRLVAHILDGLILIVPGIVNAALSSVIGGTISGVLSILALLTMLALIGYQVYLLVKEGQTLGKRIMKIRIEDKETGEAGGFVRVILKRYVATGLISAIPILGTLFALVNIGFIFRADRRCIHDHIAGTHVVKV